MAGRTSNEYVKEEPMLKLAGYIARHHLALIALFVALGGTSYAAVQLPASSVGTKQLKKNAVTAKKIRNGAVTSVKIKDNDVKGADVNEASLTEVPNAAHARNADTAMNAVNAANATTAGTATNALALGGIGVHQLMSAPARGRYMSSFLFQNGGGSPSNYQVNNPDSTAPLGTMRLSCSDPAQVYLQWVNTSAHGAWVWIDSGAATPTFAELNVGQTTPQILASDPDHFTVFVALNGNAFLNARIDVWMRTGSPNNCLEMVEVASLGRS
jgi:hypothetical protein